MSNFSDPFRFRLLVSKKLKKNKQINKYLPLLYGKVNPSVVIGSFLARISPYGPFPWKRSSAVYFFDFESRQIQNKQGSSAI